MTARARVGCLLAAFLALCASPGCGPEPLRPDPALDASPRIDAGPGEDAFVPRPDAGPPVCMGTVVACADRPSLECEASSGCRLDRCVGTADRCSLRVDPTDCAYVRGCYWSGDNCDGEPEPCSVYTGSAACRIAGCSPDDTPACVGLAVACSVLDAPSCALAPGCAAVGGPDAGTDAGADDAGPVDAGRTCAPRGSCHPLYDASCGCGYSATSFDYACGRAGTGALGAACTTSTGCGAGLWCSRRTNAATGECRRLCDADSDCGTGEGCAEIDDITISCAGYCLPLSQCSIDSQNCTGGRACYSLDDAGRNFTFCNRAGTAAENASCYGDPTACMGGYVCGTRLSPMFSRCHRVCTMSSSCPTGETCTAMTGAGETFCL